VVFAFETPAPLPRSGWLLLAAVFAGVSLLTGRRKAIVQIVVFLGLFLWLLATWGPRRSSQRFVGALVAAASVAAALFLLDPSEFLGDSFGEYVDRAASSPGDLLGRFESFGIGAFRLGLEISKGIGLGVGTLAQTGASGIQGVQGEGFAFVSESGIGKVVAELGLPGLLLLLVLATNLFQLIRANLRLIRQLPTPTAVLEIGLLAFGLSNLPFFSSSAGVYGDPFVVILCTICFGAVLAVRPLVLQARAQAQLQAPITVPPFAAAPLATDGA
jgi:hypothetical protein